MEMIQMYKEVFKDCVRNYLEDMEEEDKVILENEDIYDALDKLGKYRIEFIGQLLHVLY